MSGARAAAFKGPRGQKDGVQERSGDKRCGPVRPSGAEIGFRAAVLAIGNLVGGGLTIDGERTCAPIAPLKTCGQNAGGAPLASVLSSGLLDQEMHAVMDDGKTVNNLLVAGSAIAGLSFPLGRGLGHVASSALEAAALITEAL